MNTFEEAKSLFKYTQNLRRDFHRHPEVGYNEIRTSGIVAKELQNHGLLVKKNVGKTGVIGLLEGKKKSPVLLMRFDMDALPIQEENSTVYISQNPGVMHACGHDGHTAIGLTLAKILAKYRSNINGTIKFVFQPAEELLTGAKAMIDDGAMENPKPDFALGAHLWNEKPVGWLGITPGPIMAGADSFLLKITGKGGHGANPHLVTDPIVTSAQIISAIQTIISRKVPPLDSAVVSITKIQGGNSFNIIPQNVNLAGTIRTFKPSIHNMVIQQFNNIVAGIASSLGCKSEIEINTLTYPVTNNEHLANLIYKVSLDMFDQITIDNNYVSTVSEDMSYFMQKIPGCFIYIGSANHNKNLDFAHHNPHFDIDETSLTFGVSLLAQSAITILQH